MPRHFKCIFICTLIFCFTAGQAAAFDLRIGPSHVGPPPGGTDGHRQIADSGFGAQLTIPIGFAQSKTTADTLNGQNLSHFTKQDAKDSAIVIMLFSVAIAAGALTVSASAD